MPSILISGSAADF